MATILKFEVADGSVSVTIPDNATTKSQCNVTMDVVFTDRNGVDSDPQTITINTTDGDAIYDALKSAAIAFDDQQQLATLQEDLDEDIAGIPLDTPVEFDKDIQGTENGALRIAFFDDDNADNTKGMGEEYDITGINGIVLFKDGVFYQNFPAANYPTGVFYEELPAGEYIVNVTFDQYYTTANPSYYPNGAISDITIEAGEINDIGDFSVTAGGEIQIHAFVDTDGDGNQDEEEPNGNLPEGTFLRITPDGESALPDYGFEIESGSRTVTILPGTYDVEVIVNDGFYTVTGGTNPTTDVVVVASATENLGNRGIAALP